MNIKTLFFLATVLAVLPASAGAAPVLGYFRNTYYYVVLESIYAADPIDSSLLDMEGRDLARVSTAFKKALTIEGTGKLRDGRVLNFAGRVDGETRYRVTAHPHGTGVGDCALIPFHTIAVDPQAIPMGSVVQIDETIGMVLPDGSRHDGTWRVEDIGSAIQGDRIDLFVGDGNQGKVLDRAGIANLQALTVRVIEAATVPNCTQSPPGI